MKGIRDIKCLSSQEKAEIINSQPVILVGSAASIFAPTNVASGEFISQKLYNYIFFDTTYQGNHPWLQEQFNNIPFEAIMQCFPVKQKLPSIIRSLYNTKESNFVHRFLAKKLLDGTFSAIITPNYDLAIDAALEQQGFDKHVRIKEDYDNYLLANSTPTYFKIHGTAEDNFETTLVYLLSQEGGDQNWKKDFLEKLLLDKVLIIIGYSGKDFDICPVIAELGNYKKIVWIHYDSGNGLGLSAYADLLIKKKISNEAITGDFGSFAEYFFGEQLHLTRETTILDFETVFALNEIEKYKWQLNILNRMACVNIGMPLLESLKTRLDKPYHTKILTEMYGHIGKYRKAAETGRLYASYFNDKSKEYLLGLNTSSRFWLYYGKYKRAYDYMQTVKKKKEKYFPADEELAVALVESETTFWMRMKQILRIILFLNPYINKRAENVRVQADRLKHSGYLDEKQMIDHSFERLEIIKGAEKSLPTYKAYKNLGLPGMAIIAYRHKMIYDKWEHGETPFEKLDQLIEEAKNLGMSTELWKLYRVKLKKSTDSRKIKKQIWNNWKANLTITEYIILWRMVFSLELYLNYILKIKFRK